jgi:hypothetical protein
MILIRENRVTKFLKIYFKQTTTKKWLFYSLKLEIIIRESNIDKYIFIYTAYINESHKRLDIYGDRIKN